MATVLMKSTVGAVSFSYDLPNGKRNEIKFTKGEGQEDFTAEVPTTIEYKDDFNNTKVFHDNYAQFLLNAKNGKGEKAYPYLEIVSIKEKPIAEKVEDVPKGKGKK